MHDGNFEFGMVDGRCPLMYYVYLCEADCGDPGFGDT